ncbi:MAG: radical SAM protein [Rectinemataceae bacterium]
MTDAVFSSLKEGRIILPTVMMDMANPVWDKAAARILIVRLSPWRDVDVSTPHLVLFDEIRRVMPDAFVDFAFLPTQGDRKILSSRSLPWFFGRASLKSASEFDVVMVSNAFALELINLPYLFTTSGLSPSAAERSSIDGLPLFIAGGSNASAMGALVLEGRESRYPAMDAFVDGIFFGEGEEAIGKLALALSGADIGLHGNGGGLADAKASVRQDRLREAAKIQGFWPCLIAEGAKKALAPDRPHTLLNPLVLNGPNASSARLSITSGCPGYCSFCLEGWDRRPYAEADMERLLREAQELRRRSGAVDLEIYSFNFNTHSRIFDLVYELNRIFRRVSFMSQRLDILAETRGLIETELAGGKRSFTLGIEGISERMRAYYRKGLSDDHIDICLRKTIQPAVKELKLFFIISGMETPADIAEFSSLMAGIKRRKDAQSPSTRILVSMGFLVRQPFTPLQYAPLEFDGPKLTRLGFLLREACEQSDLEFRLASDPEECFVDQALSLAGDAAYRWLGTLPALGIVYDKSIGESAWRSFKQRLFGLDADPGFAAEKSPEFRPPLAFLESPRGFDVLHDHYVEATRLEDRLSCLGADCSACGACENDAEIQAMTGHVMEVPPVLRHTEKIEALLSAKARFQSVHVSIDFPEDLALAHPEYRMSWLLRRLSAEVAGGERVVFEARELLFTGNSPFGDLFSGNCGYFGQSATALYGPDPERTKLLLSKLRPDSAGLAVKIIDSAPSPVLVDIEISLPIDKLGGGRSAFSEFALAQKLSFTEEKTGGGWSYRTSSTSKGRRIIAEAHLEPREERAILSFAAGNKANISALLDSIEAHCFIRPNAKVTGWR